MNYQAKLDGTTLNLSDYLTAIKFVIDETFNHTVWLRAELRNVTNKGGHYYFELAEKDSNDSIIASCRATMWRSNASKITHFERTTGRPLTAGLSVLIKGTANFHPQYGFSFNIIDIDPNHTLGELAMQYQAMLKRLSDNGLLEMNKTLPTPFDIQDVIVIAPQSAAGLGDFRAEADRLANAGACRFFYYHATFQGNHAPIELRQALNNSMAGFLKAYGKYPDLLVIIRGGGAVGDLAYLNDYELAALAAEQPVPVWVGIGHEKDKTLLDEIAHTRFDTPSKVIHGIETLLKDRWLGAKDYINRIQSYAQFKLNTSRHRSEQALASIKHHALQKTTIARLNTEALLNQTKNQSFAIVNTAKRQCEHLQSLILIQHPRRTLQKGYAIVRQDGRLIDSCESVQQGDIELEFKDGKMNAQIP